jgi:hypothetical protein
MESKAKVISLVRYLIKTYGPHHPLTLKYTNYNRKATHNEYK